MDSNPFQPPETLSRRSTSEYPIQFREFKGPSFSFFRSLSDYRKKVRAKVQAAITNEIGVENLVTITEYSESFSPFSIVVWYKKDPPRNPVPNGA